MTYGSMNEWIKKPLKHSMAAAQMVLTATNNYFKSSLMGVWGRLLLACFGGGLIAGALPLASGFGLDTTGKTGDRSSLFRST